MEKEKILVYDGSFNGFLTSVFVAFDEKINVVNIQGAKRIVYRYADHINPGIQSKAGLEWH